MCAFHWVHPLLSQAPIYIVTGAAGCDELHEPFVRKQARTFSAKNPFLHVVNPLTYPLMHISPLSSAATALSVSVKQLRILSLHCPQCLPRPLATGARTYPQPVGEQLHSGTNVTGHSLHIALLNQGHQFPSHVTFLAHAHGPRSLWTRATSRTLSLVLHCRPSAPSSTTPGSCRCQYAHELFTPSICVLTIHPIQRPLSPCTVQTRAFQQR